LTLFQDFLKISTQDILLDFHGNAVVQSNSTKSIKSLVKEVHVKDK